jgi:hypothetical protein
LYHFDTSVVPVQVAECDIGSVGATVIDEYDFVRHAHPAEHGSELIDQLRDGCFFIEEGNNDRESRFSGILSGRGLPLLLCTLLPAGGSASTPISTLILVFFFLVCHGYIPSYRARRSRVGLPVCGINRFKVRYYEVKINLKCLYKYQVINILLGLQGYGIARVRDHEERDIENLETVAFLGGTHRRAGRIFRNAVLLSEFVSDERSGYCGITAGVGAAERAPGLHRQRRSVDRLPLGADG